MLQADQNLPLYQYLMLRVKSGMICFYPSIRGNGMAFVIYMTDVLLCPETSDGFAGLAPRQLFHRKSQCSRKRRAQRRGASGNT